MIHRFADYSWTETDQTEYKDEPGTWMSVTRRVLGPKLGAGFEVRYFEVAPGGYTSYERHRHEHCVMVVRGSGKVRLGNEWNALGPLDVVTVAPEMPHQFRNDSDEPFGIVCIVDRDRDRPVLLDESGQPKEA